VASDRRPPIPCASPAGIVGNAYDKYGTRNPISRLLMRGFLEAVTELYASVQPASVLEVGAGEGRLAERLLRAGPRPARFVATDISLERVATGLDPLLEFQQASVLELPFADASFDLVVCCEVLEHLDEPERALAEVARVAARAVLLSTPWEPAWRILNVARGAYWRSFGNTPGHVQHFGRSALRRLAETRLTVVEMRRPLPWTVLLGHPRPPAP
jgi:ubiquinone/menaquinone biosynthesis C-methylase UbiE